MGFKARVCAVWVDSIAGRTVMYWCMYTLRHFRFSNRFFLYLLHILFRILFLYQIIPAVTLYRGRAARRCENVITESDFYRTHGRGVCTWTYQGVLRVWEGWGILGCCEMVDYRVYAVTMCRGVVTRRCENVNTESGFGSYPNPNPIYINKYKFNYLILLY